jgi:hypothetical protein
MPLSAGYAPGLANVVATAGNPEYATRNVANVESLVLPIEIGATTPAAGVLQHFNKKG